MASDYIHRHTTHLEFKVKVSKLKPSQKTADNYTHRQQQQQTNGTTILEMQKLHFKWKGPQF